MKDLAKKEAALVANSEVPDVQIGSKEHTDAQ